MRMLSSAILTLALMLGPAVGQASAVTVRDLVMLSQAGLSDEVLVALIESDGSRFQLVADEILDLRRQGLSEKVIIAMLRTSRPAPEPAPARDGRGAVIDPARGDPAARPAEPVREPPVVTVTQQVEQRVEVVSDRVETVYVPVAIPILAHPVPLRRPPPEPVYWGWGGKRRPDTWDPTPPATKPPPAKPPSGGGGVL